MLKKRGEPVSEVYFPGRCVCSITNAMEDGGIVEVAAVGREGFIGVSVALGNAVATGDAFVQVAGDPIGVMSVDAFKRELERRGTFYDLITRYSQAFVSLLMLCAWLLALAWDGPWRTWTAAGLALAFAAIAVALALPVLRPGTEPPRFFSRIRSELGRDRELIERAFDGRRQAANGGDEEHAAH